MAVNQALVDDDEVGLAVRGILGDEREHCPDRFAGGVDDPGVLDETPLGQNVESGFLFRLIVFAHVHASLLPPVCISGANDTRSGCPSRESTKMVSNRPVS